MPLIYFSVCLLLLYRIATDFCLLMLYSNTLLNIFIWYRKSGGIYSVFYVLWSADKFTLTFSFAISTPIVSYTYITAISKISSIALNKRELTAFFPVSDFSRHALNFSFRIILAVDSLRYCLYYSCIWSLYHYSLQDFYQERCCNFSKAFSALITPSFGFCLYIYFMYCITFIDLYMLTNPCISWMKPNW